MSAQILEVKSGQVETFDGERHQVQGGAWLSPEAVVASHTELEQLRRREAASVMPLVLGAAAIGLAAGIWLGWWARDDD